MRNALCTGSSPTRARDERGFTLIEVLLAMVLGLVILTAVLQLLIVGIHRQHGVDTRSDQLQRSRTAVDGLSRDLRQATSVTVSSGRSLQYVRPDAKTITWTCTSGGVCTRTSSPGSSRVAISGVTNSTVFTLSKTNFVTFSFVVSATGRNAITLTDGVALRNLSTTTS
jgi:prepilin-type N-terminal cleavage/methylation domain-containing protein